jgi:5'-nucleotidase
VSNDPDRRPTPVVVDPDAEGPPGRPRLLVTNDDGIDSPGLRLLALRLAERHDVVVVAPDEDRSGSGTGIGRFDPKKGVAYRAVAFDGVQAYALEGPPGLGVFSAALGAFGPPPDLVVSGVNAGMNTGHSVIHSGTVGGALTARSFGFHGLAVSLAASDPWRWDTAVEVAAGIVQWMLRQERPPMVLNVNVPARPLQEIRGARWARLDRFGHVRVEASREAGDRLEFEVVGADAGRHPESDTALCLDGWVTLTPLSSVEAEPYPGLSAGAVWTPDAPAFLGPESIRAT